MLSRTRKVCPELSENRLTPLTPAALSKILRKNVLDAPEDDIGHVLIRGGTLDFH